MPDWFDTNAPKPGGEDWFARNAPLPAKPGGGVIDTAADIAAGIGKGVASTVFHGGDIIRRATGMERVIERPEVRAITQPSGTAQKVGYGIEQAGEFLLPGGAVTRLSQIGKAATAGMRGARALNIGTRAALEGIGAAGVAGVQSGGDLASIRNAALTGGALSAGTGVLAAGVKPVGRALQRSAVKQYERVLNPTTKGLKHIVAEKELAPGLIERGVIGSAETIKGKAAARVADLGQQIGAAWDKLPPGTKVVADDVITTLDDAMQRHTVVTSAGKRVPIAGGQAEQAITHLRDIQNFLLDVAEPNHVTGKLEIPVEKLVEVRRYWDDFAKLAGKFEGRALAEASSAKAQGIAADQIRKELGKDFPDIAALNKEYSFWKNAHQVANEAAQKQVGKPKGLVRRAASYAAGAAAFAGGGGIEGAIIGKVAVDQLEKLAASGAWNTVSAVTKDRIAKGLATGNRGMTEFYIAKAAKAAAVHEAAATRRAERQSPALAPAR